MHGTRLWVGGRGDGPRDCVLTHRPRAYARGFYGVIALAVVCGMVGCGRSNRPPLGLVEGTVTLDGVPLPAALVVFTPDGPGRSAMATTDTAGHYELCFLRDIAGANLGSHTVRITTADGETTAKEILPPRYHRKTRLSATVEPGRNMLDFELQSK
jgi:hypothetical protein